MTGVVIFGGGSDKEHKGKVNKKKRKKEEKKKKKRNRAGAIAITEFVEFRSLGSGHPCKAFPSLIDNPPYPEKQR